MITPRNIGVALFATLIVSGGAAAETAKEIAMSNGTQLGSENIAEQLVGKTVTFVAGEKTFLVHYGEDNIVSGMMVGGNWSDTGYYGVTNDDSVCLSWNGSDKPRLRCLTVFVLDGVVKKYNPDGSLAGDVVNFEDGKAF